MAKTQTTDNDSMVDERRRWRQWWRRWRWQVGRGGGRRWILASTQAPNSQN